MFFRACKPRSTFRRRLPRGDTLALEHLEDRFLLCAPSVHYDNEILVTGFDDVIGGDRVSLRDAVILAGESGRNTMIVMRAGEHEVSREEAGAPDEQVADLDIINSSPLAVVPSICITGAGIDQTVIDGRGLNRVIQVHSGVDVHIEGVTIRGGFAAAGGGVLNEGSLAIVDSEFVGNVGQQGGAVHNMGSLMLDGVHVHDNVAVIGGGIYFREDEFSRGSGPATIRHSSFLDNMATQHGGGIADERGSLAALVNGTLTVSDTVVRGNRSQGNGGGIYSRGSLTILRSTLDDNTSAMEGGGTYYSGGTLMIENSTFSHNTAADRGGGLNMRYGEPTIHQTTFSGNVAGRNGGGIFQDDDVNGLSLTQSTITANIANANGTAGFTYTGSGLYLEDNIALFNTIVAGNFRRCSDCGLPALIPDDVNGGLTGTNRASYNLIGVYDGEFEGDDIGNIFGSSGMPLDPRLGPLADNGGSTLTHLLLDDSPAIDAGPPPALSRAPTDPFDQRGAPRIVDGDQDGQLVIDMGAVELQTDGILRLTVGTTVDEIDEDLSSEDLSLREAILQANAYAGSVEITVPAGEYALTIVGAGEDAAATGDLDVANTSGTVRIVGSDRSTTHIVANQPDRIFDIQAGATVELRGLLVNNGRIELEDGDTRGGSGGGIFNGGYLLLSEATVTGNEAEENGGGVYSIGQLTVDKSRIDNNEATRGGGVYIVENTVGEGVTRNVVRASQFVANAADNGGAIFAGDTIVDVSDTEFSDNTAGNSGGAIASDTGNVLISGGLFTANQATDRGGAIYLVDDDLSVVGSTFQRNTANDAGGALALSSANAELRESTFSDNSATNFGGGLYALDTSVTAVDSDFTFNESSFGAGLYLDGDDAADDGRRLQVEIADSMIGNNVATAAGGGLHITRGGFEAVVRGSVIRGNDGGNSGGGVYYDRTQRISFVRTLIEENEAAHGGGGLGGDAGEVWVQQSTVRANTANRGAGIWVGEDANVRIDQSTISDNMSRESGGGLSVGEDHRLLVTNSTISGNSSFGRGGGINFYDDGFNAVILHSTITNNIVNTDDAVGGGGMFIEDAQTVLLGHSIVAGNWNQPVFSLRPTAFDDIGSGEELQAMYNVVGAVDEITLPNLAGGEGNQVGVIAVGLLPLADNGGPTETHALVVNSPAVDAGHIGIDIIDGAPFDQRGLPRVADGNADGSAVIDVGSFELQRNEVNVPPVARDDTYVANGTAQSVWQEAILVPRDERNSFGSSFALDGDRILVTTRDFAAQQGGADVYELRHGVWQQTAHLNSDEAVSNSFFPVALDGDRAVFADRRDLHAGGGAVYVFEKTDTAWNRVAKLETPEQAFDQTFGNDVDIDGNRIVVGADGFQLTDSGAAYVYELQDGAWILAQTLTAPAGTNDVTFGQEVSIEGDRIVVAATYVDDPGTLERTRTIHVFERDDTAWRPTAEISPAVVVDGFRPVYLDGDRLIVGASDIASGDDFLPGAFIYEQSHGAWQETARITVVDEPDRRWDDDDVGSVAIDGDVAVVGVDHDDDPGAVYVFRNINGAWAQTHRLFSRTPPRREDNFFVASLNAGRLAVNDSDFQEMSVYGLATTSAGTQVLQVDADNGVLHNDSDPDSDPLQSQVVVNPQHGRVTMKTDGSFTYAADEGFVGTDTFVYGISDGFDHRDFARVTIEVLPAGPIITDVIRNGDNGVLSELTSLSFVFLEDVVNLNQQDLSLVNETSGTAVDLSQATMTYAAATDTARWDLALLELQRGRYTATLIVAGVSGNTEMLAVPLMIAIPGDATLDGAVDASDFNIWNENKFQMGTNWYTGDFNGDDVTDSADFNRWLTNRWLSIDNVDDAAPMESPTVPRAALPARTPRAALSTTSPLVTPAVESMPRAQRLDRRPYLDVLDQSIATMDGVFSSFGGTVLSRRVDRGYQIRTPGIVLKASAHFVIERHEETGLTDRAFAGWRD